MLILQYVWVETFLLRNESDFWELILNMQEHVYVCVCVFHYKNFQQVRWSLASTYTTLTFKYLHSAFDVYLLDTFN